MPLYDVVCSNCDHTEEQLLKASDRDTVFTCPNCEADMTVGDRPQLVQHRDFSQGKRDFKLIDSKGTRHKTLKARDGA